MKHPLLTPAALVSLLLCGGVFLLWARSYPALMIYVRGHAAPARWTDSFDFSTHEPLWWAISNPGSLTLCRQEGKDWNSPRPEFQFLGLEYASSVVGNSSLRNLFVPYWMLAGLLIVVPVARLLVWRNDRKLARLQRIGLCPKCGYDLRATPGRCPECGAVCAE